MRTKKQILGTIASIATAASKIQQRIHDVALECLSHGEEHGDVTLFQTLYNSLPNGQRREALVEWAHTYSPIRLRQKGEVCKQLTAKSNDYTPYDLEAAAANPYWTQDERNMFKLDASKLDPKAIATASFMSNLKKIDTAIEKDADEGEAYKLDFDPQVAIDAIHQQANEWGITLAAN